MRNSHLLTSKKGNPYIWQVLSIYLEVRSCQCIFVPHFNFEISGSDCSLVPGISVEYLVLVYRKMIPAVPQKMKVTHISSLCRLWPVTSLNHHSHIKVCEIITNSLTEYFSNQYLYFLSIIEILTRVVPFVLITGEPFRLSVSLCQLHAYSFSI